MLRLLPDRLVETRMQGLDRSDCFWDSGAFVEFDTGLILLSSMIQSMNTGFRTPDPIIPLFLFPRLPSPPPVVFDTPLFLVSADAPAIPVGYPRKSYFFTFYWVKLVAVCLPPPGCWSE